MPNKVYLTKGLPASGKSTLAKSMVSLRPNEIKRINKDDLRAMLDNGQHSKPSEEFILKVRNELIALALKEGKDVIVDDTNLAPIHEITIRELAKKYKAEFEVLDLTKVPVEECVKRDALRGQYSVGAKVIYSMYDKYLKPPSPVVKKNDKLTDVIICDLDGTLALIGDRNPYDATGCSRDNINQPVLEILKSMNKNNRIIFVSGRFERYRNETIEFLKRCDIDYIGLYLRPDNDNRKDVIYKKEIYDNHIKGLYNVIFVLEDRNQTVQMWRSIGLDCLQVADGNF